MCVQRISNVKEETDWKEKLYQTDTDKREVKEREVGFSLMRVAGLLCPLLYFLPVN